ncbi:MAG: hypothetical protein EXR76_20290 [Myxococcales bacterium]|nr:hypothetical protein [Myxococcales bacterium]
MVKRPDCLPAALLVGLCLLSGCSAVTSQHVRPDYETKYASSVLRISIIVTPLPAGSQAVGDLWSMMARQYVNQHRDFIVSVDQAGLVLPADACAAPIEGLLVLVPEVVRVDGGVQASVKGRLLSCADGRELWNVEAAGSFDEDDDDLALARSHWTLVVGPEVTPYVDASFRLLTAALETLPSPRFPSDEYLREKIELGE